MSRNSFNLAARSQIDGFGLPGDPSKHRKSLNSRKGFYERYFKRIFEVSLVLLALPLLAATFAILYFNVRKDNGVFLFQHKRIGRHGAEFPCFKIRTMVVDAEKVLQRCLDSDPALADEWHKTFKLKNDPRITPFGLKLRKTGLDELPQLFNVLRGEMSLVGPRPITIEELKRYNVKGASAYLSVRPGLTGLWQVTSRRQNEFENRDKIDTEYVDNMSFFGDCKIILKTVSEVLGAHGC